MRWSPSIRAPGRDRDCQRPSFDPNPFVSGIGSLAYGALRDSPDHPLLNRTMQGQYPPGSTVKPMYALAGLYYGVNTPESAVSDPGWYRLGGGDANTATGRNGGMVGR